MDLTLQTGPSPTATYVQADWKFELDAQAVFERLVYDVYSEPLAFVRELLQNSFDATRCRLYAEFQSVDRQAPRYPTQFDEEVRHAYPVRVTLTTRTQVNEMSGEDETVQVLSVEDSGIGMTEDIVRRYLLQVGRTYYKSDEFRSTYGFVPTSRFGVGFLSVFGASDDVTVETQSLGGGDALRLQLTGPRSYLLVDKSDRRTPGTRVDVVLRSPLPTGELTEQVKQWCKRVEFPVVVNESGVESVILAEQADVLLFEEQAAGYSDRIFRLRSFPTEIEGIDGDLLVHTVEVNGVERWDLGHWAKNVYPDNHPQATAPNVPSDLMCFHGLTMSQELRSYSFNSHSMRLDYRDDAHSTTLARVSGAPRLRSLWRRPTYDSRIQKRWAEILDNHLDDIDGSLPYETWLYHQSLAEEFDFLKDYWNGDDLMIPYTVDGEDRTTSINAIQSYPILTSIERVKPRSTSIGFGVIDGSLKKGGQPILNDGHVSTMKRTIRFKIFRERYPENVTLLDANFFSVDWVRIDDTGSAPRDRTTVQVDELLFLSQLPSSYPFTVAAVGGDSVRSTLVMNQDHPLALWLRKVVDHEAALSMIVDIGQLSRMRRMSMEFSRYPTLNGATFGKFLRGWNEVNSMPTEILAPHDVIEWVEAQQRRVFTNFDH